MNMKIKTVLYSLNNGTFFDLVKANNNKYDAKIRNRYRNIAAAKEQISAYNRLKNQYANQLMNINYLESDTSESKYVWVCWFQGLENAPELVKRCYDSICRQFSDKEVVLITSENLYELINLPDYIIKKHMRGNIGLAHFSDLVRLELLVKYGGIWVDSTVYCSGISTPEYIRDVPLFVFRNWNPAQCDVSVMSNWLIKAKPDNRLLKTTRDLLLDYWKTHDKAECYFLFHIFFTMATQKWSLDWNRVPMVLNGNSLILQSKIKEPYDNDCYYQITHLSELHKLSYHDIPEIVFGTYYEHILLDGGQNNEESVLVEYSNSCI